MQWGQLLSENHESLGEVAQLEQFEVLLLAYQEDHIVSFRSFTQRQAVVAGVAKQQGFGI